MCIPILHHHEPHPVPLLFRERPSPSRSPSARSPSCRLALPGAVAPSRTKARLCAGRRCTRGGPTSKTKGMDGRRDVSWICIDFLFVLHFFYLSSVFKGFTKLRYLGFLWLPHHGSTIFTTKRILRQELDVYPAIVCWWKLLSLASLCQPMPASTVQDNLCQ